MYTRIEIKTYIYIHTHTCIYIYICIYTGPNNKIVVLKKTTLQLYFKTSTEKFNSGKFIM